MLNFFTSYAAPIQAIAAIVSFLASVGLLIATGVYVWYTKRLADFAKEQARQSALALEAQKRSAELSAVCQYFQQGDTPNQQAIRSRLWREDGQPIDKEDAAQVASYWHFWGLMVEQKLLPFWVFEGSSGIRVVQYYSKLEPFISEMKHENPHYAEHFKSLRDRIVEWQTRTGSGESEVTTVDLDNIDPNKPR